MNYYSIIFILMTLGVFVNSKSFCMKENETIEQNKQIIEKPGFKEIDEENQFFQEDKEDNESSENIDDEIYEKRHKQSEDEEKKRNKRHRQNEKNKRDRKNKKLKKKNKAILCECYNQNQVSIQCGSCKEWHYIPKNLIASFKDKDFNCINITWDPHMSKSCLEKQIVIELPVEKEETDNNSDQN